ncbi:hypothetical protein ACWEO2_03430 [Nocardia sp. NPDC004278]
MLVAARTSKAASPGGHGVGMFLGLEEFRAEHEAEVARMFLGDPHVRLGQLGQGRLRRIGGRAGGGQFAGQVLETPGGQRGEQG